MKIFGSSKWHFFEKKLKTTKMGICAPRLSEKHILEVPRPLKREIFETGRVSKTRLPKRRIRGSILVDLGPIWAPILVPFWLANGGKKKVEKLVEKRRVWGGPGGRVRHEDVTLWGGGETSFSSKKWCRTMVFTV